MHNHSHSNLIEIDTTNLYRAQVGAEGIADGDLASLQSELKRIHQTLTEKSSGGVDAEFACLNLHLHMPASLTKIEAMAASIRRFKDVAVIGIGGSSLGAKAVYQALQATGATTSSPALHFLENVNPYPLRELMQRSPENMAIICISKSGGTIETAIQYQILRNWLEQKLGKTSARHHQWLITDPDHGWLRENAIRDEIPALPVPPRVGGRYSVLSAVGLLPLTVAGVDIQALLAGAAANASRCQADDPKKNPALEIAALFYLLDIKKDKRISIMMPYADPLQLFVDWYRQLWAESLGKRMDTRPGNPPAGTLPVRAMGAVDQHSQLQMYLESRLDKIFTFLAINNWEHDISIPLSDHDRKFFPYLDGKKMHDVIEAELQATREVVTGAGHPNMILRLPLLTAHVLGQLIDLYQRVTVYAGLLYGINPLDQPAVERGKKLAIKLLNRGQNP